MLSLLGGLLIGISLGLLGSGGSILTVPVLAYGLGHVEKVAIAESLLIVGAIAFIGSLSYVRSRQISWSTALLFGLPGMVGTYGGAIMATHVSGSVQLLVFGVVILAAAALMFRPPAPDGSPRTDHAVALVMLQGAAIGVLTGFVGVGGGFLIVPALVLLRGLRIHQAIGTSLLIIAMNSSSGFVKYLETLRAAHLHVDWGTIGTFIALGTMGTLVGARISKRLDPRTLRRIFAVFLVAMSLFIIFREGKNLFTENAARQKTATSSLVARR
jgi:uncharacterized membrane protein YfcA